MRYSPFSVVAEAERSNFIVFRGFFCFFSEAYFIQRCVRRVPLFTKCKNFSREKSFYNFIKYMYKFKCRYLVACLDCPFPTKTVNHDYEIEIKRMIETSFMFEFWVRYL